VTFPPISTLDGPLVSLRPATPADVEYLVRWFNDPDVLHWLHLSEMPRPTLESESARLESHLRDPYRRSWMIDNHQGQPIGNVGLAAIDDVHFRAELYISVGERAYWSGGYGTDAIRLVLRCAFEELGLNRVFLIADADNPRAIRCYQKCGFVQEGVLRGHRLRFGEPIDMVMMSVLKGDLGYEKEAAPCPRCEQADKVIPIIYGLPGEDLEQDAKNEKVVLAGCLVGPTDPAYYCKRCGMDFGLTHLGVA